MPKTIKATVDVTIKVTMVLDMTGALNENSSLAELVAAAAATAVGQVQTAIPAAELSMAKATRTLVEIQ